MSIDADAATQPPGGTQAAKWTIAAVATLLAAAGAAAAFWPRDRSDIDWQVVRVDVSQAGRATVTFEVEKAPEATAECQVAAFREAAPSGDERKSWRLDGVVVGPSRDGARVSRHTVVVPTEGKATSAAVAQCVVTSER